MNQRYKGGLLAVMILTCGATTNAQAAVTNAIAQPGPDFTIVMPVELHALDPKIDRFKIQCAITDATNIPLQQANATLQSTGEIIKLGGLHDFTGNVTYRTSLAIPAQRALAAQYVCNLSLLATADYDGSGNIPRKCSPTDLTGPNADICVKPGAPLRPQVFGSLKPAP